VNWAFSSIIVLAESYSTCITPGKLPNGCKVGCTQFHFLIVFNRNVLDMPVPAVIFTMNEVYSKCLQTTSCGELESHSPAASATMTAKSPGFDVSKHIRLVSPFQKKQSRQILRAF